MVLHAAHHVLRRRSSTGRHTRPADRSPQEPHDTQADRDRQRDREAADRQADRDSETDREAADRQADRQAADWISVGLIIVIISVAFEGGMRDEGRKQQRRMRGWRERGREG